MSPASQQPGHSSSAERRRPSTASTMSSRSSRGSVGSKMFDNYGQQYHWASGSTAYTDLSSVPSEYEEFGPIVEPPVNYHPEVHAFCEFAQLLQCGETFGGHEIERWRQHTLSHLKDQWPQVSGCSFCSDRTFDTRIIGNAAFYARSEHIWQHIVTEGKTVTNLQPDHQLLKFMRKKCIIPEDTWARSRAHLPRVPNPFLAGHTEAVLWPQDVWDEDEASHYPASHRPS